MPPSTTRSFLKSLLQYAEYPKFQKAQIASFFLLSIFILIKIDFN